MLAAAAMVLGACGGSFAAGPDVTTDAGADSADDVGKPHDSGVADAMASDGVSDQEMPDASISDVVTGDASATDAGDIGPCSMVAGNVLYLDGDPGDFIHPGAATITQAMWSPMATPASQPDTVSIHLVPQNQAQGLWWDADFSSSKLGQPLMIQTYPNAQRLPFAQPGHPGLEVTGDGRGCNTISGTFVIYELKVDADAGTLTSFTASFVQHCEGGAPALRGCVHIGP